MKTTLENFLITLPFKGQLKASSKDLSFYTQIQIKTYKKSTKIYSKLALEAALMHYKWKLIYFAFILHVLPFILQFIIRHRPSFIFQPIFSANAANNWAICILQIQQLPRFIMINSP